MGDEKFASVAIDGPAGSGKSTIAKIVARELDFLYVDTGAMYRTVALKAVRQGINLEDESQIAQIAAGAVIEFDPSGTKVLLDGEDVSQEIRSPEITANTRYAARVTAVRQRLVDIQQAIARKRPVVMEGRDITTVVLKDARWRFYLTASAEERAKRRMGDFAQRGFNEDYEKILSEIVARDESDNAVGPMKQAQDIARAGGGITLVDTTGMSIDAVAAAIIQEVRK